jgi:hypothetical protein
MDNATEMPELHEGDQIQLFHSKTHGDSGTWRRMMVVWRGSEVVWSGPEHVGILTSPAVVVRDVHIQIPVWLYQDFHVESRPE